MYVNYIVSMGFLPEMKYLVSGIKRLKNKYNNIIPN